MSNSGKATLENSIKGDIDLELIGGTEQLTTIGKNLANPSEFVIGTLAGNTGNIINLKQYFTTGYIPVIPGKRYSTSCGNKFSAHTIIAYDKEKTKINSPINMSSEMPEGAAYIRQAYRKIDMTNVTESDMEELKKACMVNEGSTVLPYEPYTGGKPSPSTEYPQEMKNVGKWNEETQKYEVDVKIANAEQNWSTEQTLTLTSDRPITKWDKLVEQGGSMGWLYSGKIAKEFTFVSKASDENISGRIRRRFKTSLNGKFPQTDKVMCNFLTTDNVRNDYSIGIVGSGDIYIYFYENTGVETLEQANHWLKNLPFEKTIIFERKTTEFVPLSESEQTQLRNLHSYIGTTNIMVDSGEIPCGIKVAYKQKK